MDKQEKQVLQVLLETRWMALASCDEHGRPFCSWVAVAYENETVSCLMHLSTLALHTRNLMQHPLASLAVSAVNQEAGDPQQLPRLSLNGQMVRVLPSADDYQEARDRYLNHFPDAEPRFSFGDFHLFRLQIESAQFVAGFAQARKLKPSAIRAAMSAPRD